MDLNTGRLDWESSNVTTRPLLHCETIKNQAKEQGGGFLDMLVRTLGAGLLGNLLTGKRVIRIGKDRIRTG